MAITDVSQSLADIKSIGLVDNILRNFDSDLKEWQFPSDNGAKEWRKAYTLTIPAKPTGVASVTVQRTASQMSDVSVATWNAGASAQNVEVRYKDTLAASASAATGYNSPSLSWTSKTVDGDVALSCSAGSVKAFTLTISSLPTGVASLTVTRTSSPLAGASTGRLSNGATIYYGDTLTASASAATGYNAPSVNWSTLTVDGNETATAMAGYLKTFTVTIAVNNSSYGSVNKTSITGVPYGSSISVSNNKVTINGTTVTATATSDTSTYDYYFSSWSNTGGTITANRTITANFYRDTIEQETCDGCGQTGYHYCYNCGSYHDASDDCQWSGGGDWYCPSCGQWWDPDYYPPSEGCPCGC